MSLTLLVTLLMAVTPGGPGPDELFRDGVAARADAARARELFRRAAEGWDAAAATGDTPDLCLKRAKARRLAGDFPRAVAALRSGLALDPDDPELLVGLTVIRGELLYPPGAAPPDPPRPIVSPAWLALAALVGAGFVALGARRRAPLLATLGGTAWVGCAGLTLRDDAARAAARAEPVRVLVARTMPRAGNAASYPPRLDLPLPAGGEVRPVTARGGWVLVEWGAGAAGWVPADSLLPE